MAGIGGIYTTNRNLVFCLDYLNPNNNLNNNYINNLVNTSVKKADLYGATYSNQPLYFDGVNGYLEMTDKNYSNLDYSVEVIVKVLNVGTTTWQFNIFTQVSTCVNGSISLCWNRVGHVNKFYISAGDGSNTPSTNTYVDNEWYHLFFTRSSTEIKLYVNGNLEGTAATIAGSGSIKQLHVSKSPNCTALTQTNMILKTLRFYDAALTEKEVKRNYRSFKSRLTD